MIVEEFNNVNEEPVSREDMEKRKNTLAYLRDLISMIAGIMLLFSLCFRVVIVSGPSMKDTLHHGDLLIVMGDLFYNAPEIGDVVVVSKSTFDNGKPIIKRVIAQEGQTVDIDFDSGIVFVDGRALSEPYCLTPTNLYEGVDFPITVPDGCVFVMGDNRNESKDSRSPDIGMVDTREIIGRAVFLMFPSGDRDLSRIGVISNGR